MTVDILRKSPLSKRRTILEYAYRMVVMDLNIPPKTIDNSNTNIAISASQMKVISVFPLAAAYRLGVLKYEIRRPKQDGDSESLVNYVIISGLHETEEAAWIDAAIRLMEVRQEIIDKETI